MNAIDQYMSELSAALHARGNARRRLLSECREHLADAAANIGGEAAIHAFGAPAEIAVAFDTEVAVSRGVRSTLLAVAGVLATGGSTLTLIHSTVANTTAPVWWTVAFFVFAQIAGVAAGSAMLLALAVRGSSSSPAELALLSRRNGTALVFSGLTMFAAGAGVPGPGSPVVLLAGPLLVGIALIAVLRARSLARRLTGSRQFVSRPPIGDVATLSGVALPALEPRRLLALTTCVAAAAAYVWDRGEQADVSQALTAAGIEALAVTAGFLLLGRALGLRDA